jgi:hypothetical protein
MSGDRRLVLYSFAVLHYRGAAREESLNKRALPNEIRLAARAAESKGSLLALTSTSARLQLSTSKTTPCQSTTFDEWIPI